MMPVPGYLQTLNRYGLDRLKDGGDLQLENGNIAVTRDGDLQFGDPSFNALFRLVERWRLNQPTLNELFASVLSTTHRLEEMKKDRILGVGPTLLNNPVAFHEETESIGDYESGSSVFAGAIVLVLNNLLQRFRVDLSPSKQSWKSTGPTIAGYSIGSVFWAAANNFRHYDEWAQTREPTEQQKESMEVLCKILDQPLITNGVRTIRTNVCRETLLKISEGSLDRINDLVFRYANALCDSADKIPRT